MNEVWGVTFFPPEIREGICIIELFSKKEYAEWFREVYRTRHPNRNYGVTKFSVWNGVE